MRNHRLLFASIHSYLDPSSGAALCTREVLEILASRDWDCRALTCGLLDYANDTSLEDVLPHEVAPWVATIERLWDDPAFEANHRARSKAESKRWDPAFLADRYEEFFHHVAHRPAMECESLLSL
jgi:hypothetical protein